MAAEEFIKNQCHYVLHLCAEKEEKEILSYESHRMLEETLECHGIRTRGLEIKWNHFDLKGYRDMAELILQTYPEIDGVMAADMPAVAFYEAARKLGKKIPEDLCIIAYDGTYVLDIIEGNVTAIVQNLEAYSLEVVETILNMISNSEMLAESKYIPVTLKKGETS